MFRKQPLSINEFIESSPQCEQIVQCVYGLNFLEFQVFCSLITGGKSDVQALMESVGRSDRTKVNRALQKLLSLDLVSREKSSTGLRQGYRFIYEAINIDQLQQRLRDRIDSWYQAVSAEIQDLNESFEQKIQTK